MGIDSLLSHVSLRIFAPIALPSLIINTYPLPTLTISIFCGSGIHVYKSLLKVASGAAAVQATEPDEAMQT